MPQFTAEDIREIAQELEMGFRCFYHRETGAIISIPDELRMDGIDMDAWAEDTEKLDSDFTSYKEVEGIRSDESFSIMADFAEQLRGDTRLQNRLIDALNNKHPFRNFKFIIDDSGRYRQEWFDYKESRLIALVKERLERDSEDDSQ